MRMPKLTALLTVRLDPEQMRRLEALSDASDWSLSDLVRHLLDVPTWDAEDPAEYAGLVRELKDIAEAEIEALIEGAEVTGSHDPGTEGE